MKNTLIASLFFCSFFACAADTAPSQAVPKSVAETLLPARNAIKAGNYEKAIDLLTEAFKASRVSTVANEKCTLWLTRRFV